MVLDLERGIFFLNVVVKYVFWLLYDVFCLKKLIVFGWVFMGMNVCLINFEVFDK